MNAAYQPPLDFEAAAGAAADGEALMIDIDGYEGPLHLLLALARSQKVDLLRLSVTRLADQYLAFVREARRIRFVLAADYLVMAAWLAFLKSRLLLPRPERPARDGPPPEALAAQLAFRIAKLDAMRRAVEDLQSGTLLGRDIFTRGDPGAAPIVSSRPGAGDLRGLMAAYLTSRARNGDRAYRPAPTQAYRLDDARERLRALLPSLVTWTPLADVAPASQADGPPRASLIASTLSACLELVREGQLEARQACAFADIYLRSARVE